MMNRLYPIRPRMLTDEKGRGVKVFRDVRRYLFAGNGRDFAEAPGPVRTADTVMCCSIALCLVSILSFVQLHWAYNDGFSADGLDFSIALFTVCWWLTREMRRGARIVYFLTVTMTAATLPLTTIYGVTMVRALLKPDVRRWYTAEPA